MTETPSIIKFTTQTGSYYTIDVRNGRWGKNSRPVNTVWEYAAVPDWLDQRAEVMEAGLIKWSQTHGEMYRLPTVGECLYILGRDVWWLSTPVVSIEEEEQK